jgi:hypothetical protein
MYSYTPHLLLLLLLLNKRVYTSCTLTLNTLAFYYRHISNDRHIFVEEVL